jgi:uncharacterized RDD family membrane protein YckC
MSGWTPAAPAVDPSVKIPEGMAIASMGRRIGAFILDYIFLSITVGIFGFVAVVASGAVQLNQQAVDQIDRNAANNPFAGVTAPLLDVEMGRLVMVACLYVGLMALYFAGSWMAWGGSPAQKLLGLRVADASNGGNLRLDRALARWFVMVGVAEVVGALSLVFALDWVAKTPTSDWLSQSSYGAQTGFGPGGGSTLLQYLPLLWMVLMVVVTGIDKPMKQGWHDKVAGSIVLGPVQYSAYAQYPGAGAAPAWPPQPAGTPPQAPGWPPQPAGTPPQAPAWPPQPAGTPPQAPGYPPSAYPGYGGYPGYPGYPPQAQPPAPPVAPPVAPPPAPEAPAEKPKRKPRSKPQQ